MTTSEQAGKNIARPSASAIFAVDGTASAFRVVGLVGREAISTLFEIELTLASADVLLTDLPAIGERASVELTVGSRTRTIQGIVKSFEQGDVSGPPAVYRATLAPAAYVLALREDCRIFQGRTAPEIIQSVLVAAGFTESDYRISLQGVYRPREHSVQYRETDWAFLLRLLESEGIFCFFDHQSDREVLVFADSPLAHPRMTEPDALLYRPDGDALEAGEHVSRFRHVQELRAGSVALRGHSFKSPRAKLESRADTKGSAVAIYDAPPEFDSQESGERLARLRLEQELATGGTAHATSDCLAVQPGVVLALRDHGCDPLNRDWIVTSAEHRLSVAGPENAATSSASGSRLDSVLAYKNSFHCIPSHVPFRAKTRTPRPLVGIQTAVVVGPSGQEVHCDELGRVKVQFHWDREGQHDERSSSWIRVSQSWAGSGYGALFIPRVGNEVLVDFADGDPDRPIIVGSVYDGANAPPTSLPENRTATVIRSSSTSGGERFSELRMEAQNGREHVHLESARDLVVRVGQDKSETVVGSEDLSVDGDRDRAVARDETVAIGGSRDIDVAGSQMTRIGSDHGVAVSGSSEIDVVGDRSVTVGGQMTQVVGDRLKVRVGGDRLTEVAGASRESVEGARSIDASSYALDVRKNMRTQVEGDQEDRVEGAKRMSAGEIVELVCGEATITANKDGSITLVGKNVHVKVAGHVEIEGDKLSVKSQGSVNVSAGGNVKLRGRGVNLN